MTLYGGSCFDFRRVRVRTAFLVPGCCALPPLDRGLRGLATASSPPPPPVPVFVDVEPDPPPSLSLAFSDSDMCYVLLYNFDAPISFSTGGGKATEIPSVCASGFCRPGDSLQSTPANSLVDRDRKSVV